MATSFFSETEYTDEQIGYFVPLDGNYKFDTTLSHFGMMKERKFRKVNRIGDILKFSTVEDASSIYPMLDEFGYSYQDFFIFKSSWDLEYHIETNK